MDETTPLQDDAKTQQTSQADLPNTATDEDKEKDKADPRQAAMVEAFLAQQRAAMGFT